jgi:hypothetical protein
MDLGFVCDVQDAGAARVAEAEVARLLRIRPEEIDLSRFGFRSVARIVERYQAGSVR